MPFGPLVDGAWLARALRAGDPDLVVADVRWYPNRDARSGFQEAHIAGAAFVDVDRDLAGPDLGDGGRHPLPSPAAFAKTMSRLGIGDSTRVVAYDDASGSVAARLWWMLSVTGHEVAVLDGGLRAWKGPMGSGAPTERSRASFTVRRWPAERIVDAQEVDRLRADPTALLLDARAPERYRGEVEPIDPVAGHIPGARSAPWTQNLDPETGRFLLAGELRRRYQPSAARGTIAAYCGSGVTSCHNLLAMAVAGLPMAKLFVGSWSGWVADPSRPVARGTEP